MSRKQEYRFDPIRGFHKKEARPEPSSNGLNFEKISPFLRALLATDGTVTKFLEAYLWEPIQIKLLFQGDTVIDRDVPELEITKGASVLKRQVLLCGLDSGRTYTFAESLIRLDRLWEELREELLQGRLGMGEILRDRRMETYRELITYGREAVGDLSSVMKMAPDETLLYRSYRIFNKQLPTILITEKFPERYLS
ncbi:MAG: chorismate pyruvate-lyase family protein [Nitrospirota bacterium]